MASWGAGISLKGQKGDVGAAGYSVLQGSGAPTISGQVDQQLYVDTASANFETYIWSASSQSFTKTGQLRGPIGLNGINGSFFAGMGAPTTATYNGDGQAVYIQASGEVWIYKDKATGWVDTGENLVGPAGAPGAAGLRGTQTYTGHGSPSSTLSSFSPPAQAGDLYYDLDAGPSLYVLGS